MADVIINVATFRAASRLTPRMTVFRLKRVVRNFLAQRSPAMYTRYVERVTSFVPPLDLSARRVDCSVIELARSVSAFYHEEYADSIDDAARGRFTLFGKPMDFGNVESIDWHHQIEEETDFHLWRMKLAQMGFLCPMLVSGNDNHLRAVEALFASYRKNSDFGVPACFSSYWFPYSVSHRILAILSGYVLALQDRDLPEAYCREVESFLRWNVGFLVANVEHDLRNNHVERNLAALCMYFSCVDTSLSRRNRRLDREVRRIMDACILSDGFIAERSAMYQGLAVLALEIFSKAGCLTEETRTTAAVLHTKAVRAWHAMSHPDGDIALFNDSWIGEVPRAGHVTERQNFASVEVLPDAGFARLQSGAVFALMDAGPIGPRWNPGHGHADFLAVEVDIASKRFIVDPGTYQYSTGQRRTFERSASSHNGPNRTGLEPVEYSGCFQVGKMSEARFVASDVSNGGGHVHGRLELKRGTVRERRLELSPNILRVVDTWLGDAGGAFVRLTLSGAWDLDHQDDRVALFSEGTTTVKLSVVDGRLAAIDSGEWSARYLESRPATAITLEPLIGDNNCGRLLWEVRAIV